MDTFPELFTKRLKLRKASVEDVDSLIRYANNQKISAYILNVPHPYQEPDAVFRLSYVWQGFKNKTHYAFAITLKTSAELIGEISLHLEKGNLAQLGYWVGEPFWGQGIATEAIAAVLKFGFGQLNLSLIYATCHLENKASERVLLNNGLSKNKVTGQVIQYVVTRQDYTEQVAVAPQSTP